MQIDANSSTGLQAGKHCFTKSVFDMIDVFITPSQAILNYQSMLLTRIDAAKEL